jgi:hypothetical protein
LYGLQRTPFIDRGVILVHHSHFMRHSPDDRL